MVLKQCWMYIVLVLFLTGCSTLLTNPDQQNQPVIPAYVDPDEDQDDTQDLNQAEAKQAESVQMNDRRSDELNFAPKKVSPTAPIQIEPVEVKSREDAVSAIPYPLIVQSLIERAEKAINMKQWLRAQHILEQALHIAPGNAKIFIIYGDVYLNLGILAQAEQMYLRAMALAGENSVIGHMATNKLNKLETGN